MNPFHENLAKDSHLFKFSVKLEVKNFPREKRLGSSNSNESVELLPSLQWTCPINILFFKANSFSNSIRLFSAISAITIEDDRLMFNLCSLMRTYPLFRGKDL